MTGWSVRKRVKEIAPDEIFLDSSNLPAYESSQFEGRVVQSLSRRASLGVGIVFLFLLIAFGGRAFSLEVLSGGSYAQISKNNTLRQSVLFATRGRILDRNGTQLAWNEAAPESDASTTPYALRRYTSLPGFSDLLGFVTYPKADKTGDWWREEYSGMSGLELSYNSLLEGQNGNQIVETDAHGAIQRGNIIAPPQAGRDLTLSIDADVQSELYKVLSQHAVDQGFQGGAAVIMDVHTGQLLALTSFPEYDNNAFTAGDITSIRAANADPQTPLLNRAVAGLYAPGSIVKPMMAAAALNQRLISPDKQIDSVGYISVPNPYDPSHPSLFHDWTVHGWIDMRTAIAVSSDEYFYTVGGGYGGQQGLGINNIDKYAALFGFGTTTGIALPGEQGGVVPSPAWKALAFPDDANWVLGDTYHSSIGQYGWQVTPLQAVRYIAAVANGGTLLTPQLSAILPAGQAGSTQLGIPDADLEIVREGMRLGVTSNRSDAIEKFFNLRGIEIAGKTGTAQIGTHNQYENSWAVGFWPASSPKYAYAVVLEKAPAGALSGAAPGLLPFFQWLIVNHPEYTN